MMTQTSFPNSISLPNDFQPEGVAIGPEATLYVSSISSGRIYQADLRSGQGGMLVSDPPDSNAMGLFFDKRSGYLFVAGGRSGRAHVYDTETGAVVATSKLKASDSLSNDVIVTTKGAYFTDYLQPVLYHVPLELDGQLSATFDFVEIPLSGDFQFVSNAFNSNGIVSSPDEQFLIVVHSSLGKLYRIDPTTGYATEIKLGNGTVLNGDGLLLNELTLYVVQNTNNVIAVAELNRDYSAGEIVDYIRHPLFNVPTTIAEFDSFLYACNFNPSSDTKYRVVRVPKVTNGEKL